MVGKNWEFWLNTMNLALGVTTLLAVLVVCAAVGRELLARWAHKTRAKDVPDGWSALYAESHILSVPELGLTMADGGETVDASETKAPEAKPRRK